MLPLLHSHETGFFVNNVISTTLAPIPIPIEDTNVHGGPRPEDYSENADHIQSVADGPLFYKDLRKLKGKPKQVEGQLSNYKPKPPSIYKSKKRH